MHGDHAVGRSEGIGLGRSWDFYNPYETVILPDSR